MSVVNSPLTSNSEGLGGIGPDGMKSRLEMVVFWTHSFHVFLLINTVLRPLKFGSPLACSDNFAFLMSKSSRATFLLDIARTPPRFLARKDFPSPEIDE